MFNSNILDLAIALCFIYFLLALFATTINEIINAFTKIRSKFLMRAIQTMFYDKAWNGISEKIIESPFIKCLQKKEKVLPSYIPSNNFALAVTELLHAGNDGKLDIHTIRLSLKSEKSLLQGDAKRVLNGLLNNAGDSYENFIKNLEKFYDDTMERASGWFRKYNRKVLMAVSFAIVILINADTINICSTLWKDQNKLKEATEMAIEYTKGRDTLSERVISYGNDTTDADTLFNRIVSSAGNVKNINMKLKEIPIPLGWSEDNYPSGEKASFTAWVTKVAGWSLTALAIFLGAPFWFDLLNKIVVLRAAGKKPEKEKEAPEK